MPSQNRTRDPVLRPRDTQSTQKATGEPKHLTSLLTDTSPSEPQSVLILAVVCLHD